MFLGSHFNYSSKILSLTTKVVVNQLVFTPVFISYFFGMQSFLSGDSLPEVWERIQRTVPISFVNSCKLWPAATAFSFTFIDPQYRNIFAGFVAVVGKRIFHILIGKLRKPGAGAKPLQRAQRR
jgi:protein Mpv17